MLGREVIAGADQAGRADEAKEEPADDLAADALADEQTGAEHHPYRRHGAEEGRVGRRSCAGWQGARTGGRSPRQGRRAGSPGRGERPPRMARPRCVLRRRPRPRGAATRPATRQKALVKGRHRRAARRSAKCPSPVAPRRSAASGMAIAGGAAIVGARPVSVTSVGSGDCPWGCAAPSYGIMTDASLSSALSGRSGGRIGDTLYWPKSTIQPAPNWKRQRSGRLVEHLRAVPTCRTLI